MTYIYGKGLSINHEANLNKYFRPRHSVDNFSYKKFKFVWTIDNQYPPPPPFQNTGYVVYRQSLSGANTGARAKTGSLTQLVGSLLKNGEK